MSNVNEVEAKVEKCVLIGKKYFFNQGKYSINPKCVGLPFSIILYVYNFVHVTYYQNKLIENNTNFIIILIINILLFTLQVLQSLNTAFTDPGSFLPNYGEDKSNSSEAKLMIATINSHDYFLKFCRTCLNAKDLRVYHCPDCGLCILRHDHHCPWLSTCIGLNNHKHFIILIIINIFFYIFNTILLIIFTLSIINNDKISDLANVENIFLYILLIINSALFLFHFALFITHSIYIITGQTTSEKIRRAKGAKNPYSTNSALKNIIEFWKYPMRYREKIEYNQNASNFLDTNILICDYLSGNYYLTPDKKVISQTYVDKGYNYTKAAIELINTTNNTNEETETTDSVKLDEVGNDNNDKI